MKTSKETPRLNHKELIQKPDTPKQDERPTNLPLLMVSKRLSDSSSSPCSSVHEEEEEEEEISDQIEDDESSIQSPLEQALPPLEQFKDLNLTPKVIHCGYVKKKSHSGWHRRWLVLRSTHLAYYKDEQEYQTRRIIDIKGIHSVAEVKLKKREFVFGVVTKDKTFNFQVQGDKEFEDWFVAFENVLGEEEEEEEEEILEENGLRNEQVLKQGFIEKYQKRFKTWRKRWAVLRSGGRLTIYRDEREYSVIKLIKLCNVLDIMETEAIGKRQFCYKIILAKKNWIVSVSSLEEQNEWVQALVSEHRRMESLIFISNKE